MKQSVYLLFDGEAREAVTFYQECLGGDLNLTSIGESPMNMHFPEHFQEKILNGRLQNEWLDISTLIGYCLRKSLLEGICNACTSVAEKWRTPKSYLTCFQERQMSRIHLFPNLSERMVP